MKDYPYVGSNAPESIRDDQTSFRLRLFAAKLIEWRVCGRLSGWLYRVADRLDQRG